MKKEYTIADRTFYQDELVYGQLSMLRDCLKKYPIDSLTHEHLIDLVLGDVTSLLAVVLIPMGQTQQEKVRAGSEAVKELEAWLNEHLRPSDAEKMVPDFFALNPVEKMTLGFQSGLAGIGRGGNGSKNLLFS